MSDRRILRVVQDDVVQLVGDQGFMISEFLLGGLLAKVGNRQNRYISGTAVDAPQAAALAAAIEMIEQTPGWELARAINGDETGEGVTAFCVCAFRQRRRRHGLEDRGNSDKRKHQGQEQSR